MILWKFDNFKLDVQDDCISEVLMWLYHAKVL